MLIKEGDVMTAIRTLTDYLESNPTEHLDEAHYLLGNTFRKLGDWKRALDAYQAAIDINPESPAMEARSAIIDILNFYNKDMYNQ